MLMIIIRYSYTQSEHNMFVITEWLIRQMIVHQLKDSKNVDDERDYQFYILTDILIK